MRKNLPSTAAKEVPQFEEHVKNVVRNVRGTFADLLSSVGADPTHPQDMARQFGLNKNLTWKVSKIICESDPCAAIPLIPGRSGLNILINTLKKAGATEEAVSSVRTAITEFDEMVQLHAGDRATLELMLGNLTDDGEPQRQEANRKLAFRGNSAIWGVQARVQLTVNFITPGTEEDWMDLAWLSGLVDFRRLRLDVTWAMASAKKVKDDGSLMSLGPIEPIDPEFKGGEVAPLLGDFCSKPLPEIRTVSGPESLLRFELVEGEVGNTAATTCFIGLFGRNFVNRYRMANDTLGEHFARLSTPTEMMIHDLFVHKDLESALKPRIHIYSQLPGGPVYPQSGRDRGEIPVYDKVIELGKGPRDIVTPEVPRYRRMVQSVYDRLGWDADEFYGFRFKMRYPPIPTMAVLRYDLPEKK
jgi:hypothetical protein